MALRAQIRRWCSWAGLVLTLAVPSFAQNRRDQRPVPRPKVQERREARREARQERREVRQERREQRESAPQSNRAPAPQFQPVPQPPQNGSPQYRPPVQGHHSGQWLNQHRDQTPDQQKQALENDPTFRKLSPERQQRLEQRLQRFNSLPPDRQQQVLRRMETWEHLTTEQKQDLRGIGQQYNNLPPDRRRAVRNAIETLRAMPPEARQRELESGRFNQFSPQERQILDGAARLPLAPASEGPNNSNAQQQNSGQQRYVPRPPK